ncbi:MAG: class I SAM-dependent methyltransferase [Alphaproteobacteria bacterium]|nr:class I SAM-dependent methyltransferase [Alphaproteobacteria bacterium]
MFQPCEICGADDWSVTYEGLIRAGGFGQQQAGGIVGRCGGCGVERLDEACSVDSAAYESEAYRAAMGQGLSVEEFFAHADPTQLQNLTALWPYSLRGKVVADIGCGAGSFLDHIAGIAGRIIAVEPTPLYHDSLSGRGYTVYPYAADAAKAEPASADAAVTFQVIEHVPDPVAFLKDIAALLKPGAPLLIATPNRADILMSLLPEEFPSFYYRRVHRWYFDATSLRRAVERAGFQVQEERFLHGFGMANMLAWLRDRKPAGHARLPGIDRAADAQWKAYLEASGQADTLYLLAKNSG